MVVPIYLVKKKLDAARMISSSTSVRSRDSTHWALVVNGKYYHITAKTQYCPIELNPERIPEDQLLPWTSSKSKYKHVGDTGCNDYVIRYLAQDIIKTMGSYEILLNNCQVFANMLYLQICDSRPTFDLLGEAVVFRDVKAVGLRAAEWGVRSVADALHVPSKFRIVGPTLDRLAKRYGG